MRRVSACRTAFLGRQLLDEGLERPSYIQKDWLTGTQRVHGWEGSTLEAIRVLSRRGCIGLT